MVRAGAALRALEDGLLALLAALLVLLAGGQIAARWLFSGGSPAVDAAMPSLVLWIALLGAMIAARERKHLAIDALSRWWRGGTARGVAATTELAAAATCATIAWHAARLVLDERAAGTIAFASVPAWAIQAAMPVAFAVIAGRLLRDAWRSLRGRAAGGAGA